MNCVCQYPNTGKLLANRSDIHWYCPPCEEKAIKSIRIEKEIEERCKVFLEKNGKQSGGTRKKTISKKVEETQVRAMIEKDVTKKLQGDKEGARGAGCRAQYINQVRK